MAQWILKANGRVVPRRSLRPLKVDEIHSPVEIKKREVFDKLIERRLGTPMTPPNTQQPKAFENMKITNNKNSQHLKLKTLLTLLASSSTSNQHMTKLSMLKSSYNLEKKWSLGK